MEFFALNEAVAELESTLPTREGAARVPILISLAWQLRQRDCARALRLADEAEALLDTAGIDAAEQQRSQARLHLVRGEVDWLFGKLDAAANHADVAIQIFERLGDRIGVGDGQCLQASIWHDRGDTKRRHECIALADAAYRAGGDQARVDVNLARSLAYAAFQDSSAVSGRLAVLFDTAAPHAAMVETWLAAAQAFLANFAGDLGNSIKCFFRAHQAAQQCGQIRQAIVSATNCAVNFADLGDLDAALEWDERALALASETGWPGMKGNTLTQTGNALRLLGRPAEALSALREALSATPMLKNSQNYALTLQYLGDVSLDMNDLEAARDYFMQAEQRALALGEPVFVLRCWEGQAVVLCRLGQFEEARIKVAAALAAAKSERNTAEQIKALRINADLCQKYKLPPPAGVTDAGAPLHYLNEALVLAATIDGYVLSGELLDEVANAYAAIGDYHLGYTHAQAAAGARDSKQLDQARSRAIAMQLNQEAERERAEAERHRQRAETDARRAADLQEASATLETLGLIGREITASLSADAVYATLYRHVNQMLDVSLFSVHLLDLGGKMLLGDYAIEAGRVVTLPERTLDHPTSYAARCARECQEIVIDVGPDTPHPNRIPGTQLTLSLLYSPLMIGDRLLGVMSIQSTRRHAYAERERSIFRTLCAYGAIALDNAGAYAMAERARRQADEALAELREAQAQLIHADKLASLGALVAGVAHEINTPLGICVTAASHLNEELQLVVAERVRGPLSGEGLTQFLEEATDTVRILQSNTQRAANLIHSFKQVSVDQASGAMRSVNLADYLNEVLVTLRPSLKGKPVAIKVACPADLFAYTYPGALAQVITNLVMNSVIHGFEGRDRGEVSIAVSREGDHLHLRYADDGLGMDDASLKKLFDPFYTTKRGTGGSGLGAHIVYNLVTGPLAGRIRASSTPGLGLQFDIRLPVALAAVKPHSAH